jgi:hypothetical protein
MKPSNRSRTRPSWLTFSVAVVTIVGVTGLGLFVQWEETVRLRAERELGLMELRDAEKLRLQNRRLREVQIAPVELDALRADHAALMRLRAELDTLSRAETAP